MWSCIGGRVLVRPLPPLSFSMVIHKAKQKKTEMIVKEVQPSYPHAANRLTNANLVLEHIALGAMFTHVRTVAGASVAGVVTF